MGAGEAPPARTQTVATAPSPGPAAAALTVVAGSDVAAEGRAGSGSGRWVARRQVQSAAAVVREAPWAGGLPWGGGERRPRGARRRARVSVRISPGSRAYLSLTAGCAGRLLLLRDRELRGEGGDLGLDCAGGEEG